MINGEILAHYRCNLLTLLFVTVDYDMESWNVAVVHHSVIINKI